MRPMISHTRCASWPGMGPYGKGKGGGGYGKGGGYGGYGGGYGWCFGLCQLSLDYALASCRISTCPGVGCYQGSWPHLHGVSVLSALPETRIRQTPRSCVGVKGGSSSGPWCRRHHVCFFASWTSWKVGGGPRLFRTHATMALVL